MAEVMRMRFMFCYIRSGKDTDRPSYRGTDREAKTGGNMASAKRKTAVIAMASATILTGNIMADAQNRAAPPPAATVVPASALDNLPHRDISNGIISAKVYLPGEG